jgi:hypothetical protein
VTYSQYGKDGFESLKGYSKIDMTCRMAQEQGCRYVWVDMCCIDKNSSAELSEAINSMYRWYERAELCYVYLSDLAPAADWLKDLARCSW